MAPRTVIQTPMAPQAIGPYSQAIRSGDLVFCSGQIPLNPDTGDLVADDVEVQTRQVMQNIQAVLEAAGTELASVVKATIFLTDMEDFVTVNQVYGSFFVKDPPARSTIQVAALPKDARVEIEVVALVHH